MDRVICGHTCMIEICTAGQGVGDLCHHQTLAPNWADNPLAFCGNQHLTTSTKTKSLNIVYTMDSFYIVMGREFYHINIGQSNSLPKITNSSNTHIAMNYHYLPTEKHDKNKNKSM